MTTPAFGEVKENVRAEMLAVALSRRLGLAVTIEPARTYDEVESALEHGTVDAVWGTAELCNRFEQHARAILRAVRSGSSDYYAALICRADEPLTLDSLDGTNAAWVTRWSTAGYLLPRAFLAKEDIDADQTFASQKEYGTYRRALEAVLEGEADLASIYCTQADDRSVRAALSQHVGRREGELRAFAFSDPVPSDGVIVTQRMPEDLADRFIDALLSLGQSGAGLIKQLGLFDTEGFTVEGRAAPAHAQHAPQHTPLMILEVTPDALCARAWSQSGHILGRPCSDLAKRPLAEVLGPDAAAPICLLVADAFKSRTGGRVDYHVGQDEETRWYSAELFLANHSFNPGGAAALIVRDVTDERALEQELFHLASFPLLDPQPVLEIDRDGELRYANRAAHHMFPALLTQGADHPIVGAMLAVSRTSLQRSKGQLRDVEVDGRFFRLSIISPPEADFIRAAVIDMTDPRPKAGRTPSGAFRAITRNRS